MCMHAQKERKEKTGKGESLVGYSLCQCPSLMHIRRCVQGACIHSLCVSSGILCSFEFYLAQLIFAK